MAVGSSHGSIPQLRQCHNGPAAALAWGRVFVVDVVGSVLELLLVGVTEDSVVIDAIGRTHECYIGRHMIRLAYLPPRWRCPRTLDRSL